MYNSYNFIPKKHKIPFSLIKQRRLRETKRKEKLIQITEGLTPLLILLASFVWLF